MLINLDFKQVEVVVLAQLSGDKDLQELINNGRDIYKYFAMIMYDKSEADITPEERNSLKASILGISYGRGPKALAEESGKSPEWCQDFIDRFYQEFPKTKELHDKWIAEVERTGKLKMWTGIEFRFKKYIWNNNTKKKEQSNHWKAKYWHPEIKNYPVQHTAFVILSTYVATFFRQKALFNREKYLLINTVHDSIMLDVRPEYIKDAKKDLKDVLDNLPEVLYNKLGFKLDVKVSADMTEGESWYDV